MPTRCSSIAAWTSAPPSSPSNERRGIPHHQLDVLTSPKPRLSPATSAAPPRTSKRSRPGGGADRRRRLDALHPVAARRLVVSRHRPVPCARAGSSGLPRSGWAGCTPSWPAGTRSPPRRSCPPTAGARCGLWRSSSSPGSRSPRPHRSIGAPRWDTLSSDWTVTQRFSMNGWPGAPMRCLTTVWSTRCRPARPRPARRDHRLPGAGLRAGVRGSRCRRRRGRDGASPREQQRSWAPVATCDGTVMVPPRPPGALADVGDCHRNCGRRDAPCGGTYPETTWIFAKGHGTQNDFVVLPDVEAELALTAAEVAALCDRRRGLGADGRAAGHHRRCGASAGVLDASARRCERRRLVHGLPQRRRLDRPDVRQRCAGVRALLAGQRPGSPDEFVVGSLAGPRPVAAARAPTRPTPMSPSTWARPTADGSRVRSSAGGTFERPGGRRRQSTPGVCRSRR